MTYKGHEIYARVCGTYSDLYDLKRNGELKDSQDIIIYNEDEQVVWYEVSAVDPESGYTTMYMEIRTLEEVKEIIDKSVRYTRQYA